MKNHKRRSLAAIPLLAAVVLLCFSSAAWAESYGVTGVTIKDVWGDGIGEPLARPGGKVWVSAKVTKKGIRCKIYMGITIGGTVRDLEHVGAINWDGDGTSTMTWSYTLKSDEADGVKDVTVTVRAMDLATGEWYGSAMSVTRQNGFTVDGTAPYFGVWSPVGPIHNQTSGVFTAPIGDATSGVDWGKTISSAAVTGGTLSSAVQQDGKASISVTSMNQPGTKSIQLTAYDRANNTSTSTHRFEVVDSKQPTMGAWEIDGTPVASGVRIFTDSATFGMTITDDVPTLGIASVVASLDGGGDMLATLGNDNRFAVAYSGLSDGDHSLTLTATDGSGNSNTSTLSFTVDAVAPEFSNPSPVDGLETNTSGITPSIHITHASGRLKPDTIKWTMTGPDSLAVSGGHDWSAPVSTFIPGASGTPAPLAKDGIYSLKVYAEDEAGHKCEYPPSGAWQFLLDTVDPVIDSTELNVYRIINGLIYTPRNGGDGRELKLTVTVSDPGSTPSGFNVSGKLDVAVSRGSARTDPVEGNVSYNPDPRPSSNNESWTAVWTPKAMLPDGAYCVQVVATDDAGNITISDNFEFIVDATAPDIRGNRAEVGFLNATNDKRFTNSRSVRVKWDRPSDASAGGAPGSGLVGYSFEIWTKEDGWTYGDGKGAKLYEGWTDTDSVPLLGPPLNYLRPTGSSAEIWHSDSLGLESGKSYGAWIRAWDMLHNASDWFDPPFIFDADPPADPGVPEVQNLSADRRTRNNMPKLKWAHSTDGKAWAQSGVDLYEMEMARVVTPPQPTVWDIYYKIDIPDEDVDKHLPDAPLAGDSERTVSTPLADDEYVVRVRAKDVAGNYSNWAEIAAPFTIDTQAPAVPGMPVTTSPTKNTTPTWTWTAETDSDFHHYNVYADGVKVVFEPDAEPTTGSYTSAALGHGMHVLEVTSVDDLGNESARSTQGHVLIDTRKPAVPVMNPMPQHSKPGQITFSWSVSDDLLEVRYNFQYSLDGGETWKETVEGLTVQSYTVDASAVADGKAVVGRAMAYDAVGNGSDYSASVSTIIDGTGPDVSGVSPLTAYRTRNTRPTWEWNWNDHELSGLDYFIVTLDGEFTLQTTSTSFTPSSDLFDGEHTLKVQAVDKVGNLGNLWTFVKITIDATAPEAPGMPVPEQDPTNDNTPKWTWPAIEDVAGDFHHYNVYEDGEKVAEVTDPEYTSEELADGLHVLEVTSVDDLGNESAKSTQGHVMVDLVAPDVPTMNPMPAFSKRGNIPFSWSASTDNLEVKYNFQYSTDNRTTWNTLSGLTWQSAIVAAGEVADGTKVYGRVMAYDAVLNDDGYSLHVSTRIDATAPVVTDETEGPTRTNNATPTWTWSVVETGSGLDYFLVTLDSELPVRTTGTSFTPSSRLTDGDHKLFVQGVDKVGNTDPAVELKTVTIDTTPPAVPGMPKTTSPTNNRSPVWTWGAVADAAKYRVFEDELDRGFVTEPTYTSDNLGEGTHYLQVTALDALGNESARSEAGYVVIDTTGPRAPAAPRTTSPTISALQLWEWDYVEEGATLEVQKSVPLAEGEGWTWSEPEPIGNALTYITDFTGNGVTRYLRVRAYDALGNVGYPGNEDGWSGAGSVLVDTVRPEPPADLEVDETPTADKQPTWTWTASASTDAASYEVSLDGAAAISVGSVIEYTPTPLADGTHALKVRTIDLRGNVSGWTADVEVLVDTMAPAAPVIEMVPSVPYTNANLITLIWTQIHDAVKYDLEYAIGGAATLVEDLAPQTLNVNITSAVDGDEITAKVQAYDAVGNVSGWSNVVSTTVDRTGPVVSIVTQPGNRTINSRPTWAWSGADPLSGVDYYIVTLGDELPFETEGTSFTPESNLADGAHVLKVKAVDKAGNESEELVFDPVIVDINAPDAPAIEPTAKGYNTSPLTLKWNAIADGDNAIAYVLQWAHDAGFSGAHDVAVAPVAGQTPEYEFSFTGDDRGEGEYWFRVKTVSIVNADTDPAEIKESGWSAAVSTICDVTPPGAPTLVLETPSPTNQSPQRWSWTAPEGAVGYEVRASRESSDDWQDIGNACTRETTFTESGIYTFEVRAYDWLGNKGDDENHIASGEVKVDVTAPEPPTGLSLTEPEGTLIDGVLHTADATPKVRWNGPGDAVCYDIWLDGQYWISTANTAYEFTVVLAEGVHTVKITAADALGNSSDYSDPLAFVVDTTPPARLNAPETTSPTNATEQVWTWNAVTDADLGRYEIMIDGVLADPVLTPDPAKSATYTTSLDEGVHFLQVRAADNLGNTSLWSEKGYVTIDRTGPAAPAMRTLPPFTNAAELTFEWSASSDAVRYELSYSRDAGASWTEADLAGVKSDPVDIRDVSDGVAVLGRVRAYDAVGNVSPWSDELPGALIASTVVDRTGPRVTMTSPTEPVATNASTFTWTWTGIDDGSGVQNYMISLDGVSWLVVEDGASYMGKLCEGDNRLWVKGVDKLGNVSVDAAEAAVVTQVVPQIVTVEPVPGAMEYRINDISTIAFQVVGLHDAAIEVRVNKSLLEPWRIVTLIDTPALAKFYILLDGAVMQPGPLTVTIRIGDITRYCDYSVLNERSGFGFGRLRPW